MGTAMAAQIAKGLISRRSGLVLITALVFGSLLAACGGSEPTLAPTTAPVSANSLAPSTSGANGLTQAIEDLDADTIVAAHEAVLVRLYENLLPSVVHIRISQRIASGQSDTPPPSIPGAPLPNVPEDFFQRGDGSGFVWDEEGHIVTNNHVIQGADRVTVVFADRTEWDAKVIGTDPDSDLAVLELSKRKIDAPPVVLGDSATLKVGQVAVAIGNPFGQEFTMTSGIVSALGRTIRSDSGPFSIPEVIQSDVPINPGNSGGPLLDRQGRVIGVNTRIISLSGVSSGVGFSVPINTAKRVIPALIEDGRYEYSWLGITGSTLRPAVAEQMDLPRDTGGALLIQVSNDSPADRAGLRGGNGTFIQDGVEYSVGGDIIVAVDGSAVRDMNDLIAYLVVETRPGDKVILEVIRNGKKREELEVTLGKRSNSGQ